MAMSDHAHHPTMRDAVPPPPNEPTDVQLTVCAVCAQRVRPGVDDIAAIARAIVTVLHALPIDAEDAKIDAGDDGTGRDRMVVEFRRSPFATPTREE